MSALPTVIVGGIPALAAALTGCGRFPSVLSADTTQQVLDIVTGPEVRSKNASELVFIFGDTIAVDNPNMPIGEIVRRLTAANYQVIIVTITPKGAELQRANPQAGLLALPLRLNEVLFAIGTFGYPVEPLPDGYDPIDLEATTGRAAAPAAPAVATPAPTPAPVVDAPQPAPATAPASAPTAPVAEPAPAPSGWQAPPSGWATPEPELEAPEPVAPVFNESALLPWMTGPSAAEEQPLTPPAWAQPAAPATEPTTPAWAQPSAPEPAAPAWAAPVPQEAAPTPWTSPAPSEPAAPAWAAPQPAWTPAPTEPADPAASAGPALPTWGAPSTSGLPTFGGATTEAPAPTWAAPAADAWAGAGPVSRAGSYPSSPAMPQRRGYVVTIAVSKGGVGKSSMTLNLAAFLGMRLRAQGKTVAVIDANFQQADSGKYLDCFTPNINTIVNNPALLTRERILEALVTKPEFNMSVLLGPATPDEGDPLALEPRLYNEILDLLVQHFDYVLIDTPVAEKFHAMFYDFALKRADYIVVPVAPNFTTLHNADNWLRAAVIAPKSMGGSGVDPNRIGIVLNRAEDNIGCSEQDVRQTMASWHFLGSIPETKEWKAANNRNELVAPKNYAELSQAFAEVLHAATGEPTLLENLALVSDKKRSSGGLADKLKGMLRRNG